jgi:hypothetical protein
MFWSTYTDVAVKYARMAQQLGVEMFSLGSESDRLFRTRTSARFPEHFRVQLAGMVAAVRAEFSGIVTYNQQSFVHDAHPEWWGLDREASASLAEDLGLDVSGLSGYFTIVGPPVTRVHSVAELEVAWRGVFEKILVPLQMTNLSRPMVFTDTGIVDLVGAPADPVTGTGDPYVFTDSNGNGVDDGMEQQAHMFEAFFNVNRYYDHLVRGTFIWGNAVDTDPLVAAWNDAHRDMVIHGRPAELVIRGAYQAIGAQGP